MARRSGRSTATEDPIHLSAMAPAIGQHLEIGDEDDDELDGLDNPDVEELSDAPVIGTRSRPSDMFGESAETFGRATSPKLYATAGRMPTATQYRVWRWENGVPVALGVIDVEASEEDFVRQFSSAMPRKGEGRAQYRLRPIDIRGQELGKEFTLTISEHHATIQSMRASTEDDRDYERGNRGDVYVNGGNADASMAEEMGRMFESAVENAERRTELLQQTLEQERERLRMEEARRAEERVGLAERSADVVQKMTERLMASDRARAEEALKAQKDQGQFLVQTLTAVFSQQQVASREQHDRMREADMARLAQDREFFERQRQEISAQRQHEREEEERRRQREREEWERRREVEKGEMVARLEQAKMDMELRRLEIEKERDRVRSELEERRRIDREEYERRQTLDREERERRERADRERWERERQDWERRETLRREELQREERVRAEQLSLQQKALEVTAQKDREHAERMMELARQEREAQREAQANRERMEREAREAADRERQRQHDLQIREMELSKERDREHAERMIQISKDKTSGGLSGITEMLGMDAPELLGRIFGGGGSGDGEEETGGWKAALPAVLGALAGAFAPKPPAPVEAMAPEIPPGAAMVNTPNGPRLIPMNALAALQQQRMQPRERVPVSSGPMALPDLPAEPSIPVEQSVEEVPAEPDLPAEYKAAQGADLLTRAKGAGVPLSKQKSARKAIRELVEQYASAPEEKWTEVTTAAVLKTPAIFDYLQAVGVWAALVEAKAEPSLAGRVVAALKASGMIPDTMPFTEDDVAAKAAKKEEA